MHTHTEPPPRNGRSGAFIVSLFVYVADVDLLEEDGVGEEFTAAAPGCYPPRDLYTCIHTHIHLRFYPVFFQSEVGGVGVCGGVCVCGGGVVVVVVVGGRRVGVEECGDCAWKSGTDEFDDDLSASEQDCGVGAGVWVVF